jgi:signal transduction histidine kinase
MMRPAQHRLEVTFVTSYAAMTESPAAAEPRRASLEIDPRRSLAAAAMWLIIGLAATFSIAAAVWVGKIARENVIEQHVRRLSLETEQFSSDLGQALAARFGAMRAARSLLRGSAGSDPHQTLLSLYDELASAYPELEWIAVADSQGIIVNSRGFFQKGAGVGSSQWFTAGVQGPWLGRIAGGALGDMSAPIRDETGRTIGVIAAHIGWPRAPNHPLRLTDESDPRGNTQAYVLDRSGMVLIGPEESRGRRWSGVPVDQESAAAPDAPRFERLPNGRRALVSRSPLSSGGGVSQLGWEALLCDPIERVYQRADAVELQILWVSLGLGAVTALLGTVGALHLTRRLKRLAQSVAAAGRDEVARIEIPKGRDEVAQLAGAFAEIHGDLQQERSELRALSGELERRVAVRTREVERLAEESRYAAIVRERLKIARDLHDTLAHSMMAMLSEIRFLRKLQARDPGSVAEELARAEEVAREGLNEARAAITQMRVNAVRETGLGPALSNEFCRFIDRTGLMGEFTAEAEAAGFGDERAETILRMAQEILRNVERHAQATRLIVSLQSIGGGELELRVEDNGIGFDPLHQSPGHYGMVGLREQAELIGANIRFDSAPNAGTKVTVSWRLSPIEFGKET